MAEASRPRHTLLREVVEGVAACALRIREARQQGVRRLPREELYALIGSREFQHDDASTFVAEFVKGDLSGLTDVQLDQVAAGDHTWIWRSMDAYLAQFNLGR